MARTKKIVNPDSFYTVYSWMPVELGLSGNDLLVYAFIYAYSTNESGKGCYFGGYEALSQSLGCTTKSVERIVHKLHDESLIEIKQAELENGLKRNYYRGNPDPLKLLADRCSTVHKGLAAIVHLSEFWENLTKLNGKTKRSCKLRDEADRVF